MESLFSLEVIINYVKLNNNLRPQKKYSPNVSCLFPCVAFRLLDYPTIAINLLDDYDSKELKSKLEITQPFDFIEKLACFTELLDKHGRYIFSKGKSCLFRADLESLQGHLKNTPMYLMILDTFFEPFKLIGTVLVPLTNLINEIYEETFENTDEPSSRNVDVPCIKMTHGVFEIKNLMGDEIGHVSFACRLTSFGKSLLPHIDRTTTEAVQRRQQTQPTVINTNTKQSEVKEKDKEKDKEQEVYLYELHKTKNQASTNTVIFNQNAIVQTVPIDYKNAQVQISDYPNSKKVDKFTQSPGTKRKFPTDTKIAEQPVQDIYQVKHVQDEFAFNHYCPPPLNYNSNANKNTGTVLLKTSSQTIQQENKHKVDTIVSSENIVNEKVIINKRIEYLKHAVNVQEDEQFEDSEDQFEEPTEYIVHKPLQSQDQFNFDQMPLLKCLFDEINNLKNLMNNQSLPKPGSVFSHPKPKINPPTTRVKVKPKTGGILRHKVVNDRDKRIEIINRLSAHKAPQVASEYDEIPVRGVKNDTLTPKTTKKPLKYGLTNTHRMRVLANRPSQVKEIEDKHESLMRNVKKNLDDLNLSTANLSIEQTSDAVSLIQKNLEKVLLFESTNSGSGTYQNRLKNNTYGSTNKSGMNLSLLNRVEMESTFDTMNYQNTRYLDGADQRAASPTKVVQFGNTYVYNTSAGLASPSSNSNQTNNQENEMKGSVDESSYSRDKKRNIFLENGNERNQYEEDFNSSLDSSLHSSKQSNTTTSNFITANMKTNAVKNSNEEYEDDYEEEEEEEENYEDVNLLNKIKQSDLKSSSKYSSFESQSNNNNTKSYMDESLNFSNRDINDWKK